MPVREVLERLFLITGWLVAVGVTAAHAGTVTITDGALGGVRLRLRLPALADPVEES